MLEQLLDLFRDAEFRPIDQDFLRELGPTVLEIIRNPASNLLAAVVILLIISLFLLLVVLAVILWVTRASDEQDYEYVIVGSDSGQRAASAGGGSQEPTPQPAKPDPLRLHRLALGWIGAALVLLIAGGVGSQGRSICMSCHDGIPHTEAVATDAHQSIRCVSCHETGGVVSSVTLAVPARMWHIVTGMTAEERSGGYGVVAGRACVRCHEGVTRDVIEIPDRALLVSHPEPLEAGAGCMDCHGLDDTAKLGRSTAGMAVCMRCHNDEDESAVCETCHTDDVSRAVLTSREHESRQLIAQPDCYTCHESAGCDSCHGVRLPHPLQYVRTHMMDAARDIWFNGGRTCTTTCHTSERNSCYQLGCHAAELDYHRGEDPTFPRTHGRDPDWRCDLCHAYAAQLDDPCQMCH